MKIARSEVVSPEFIDNAIDKLEKSEKKQRKLRKNKITAPKCDHFHE